MLSVRTTFIFIHLLLDIHLSISALLKKHTIGQQEVICKLQPNPHNCDKSNRPPIYRFYYDIKMEDCKAGKFGTCSNDDNRFTTLPECQESCRDSGLHPIKSNLTSDVFCKLQPDFGHCNDYIPMWYFDLKDNECRGFSFSGCGGNANRFHTSQVCTRICATTTIDNGHHAYSYL